MNLRLQKQDSNYRIVEDEIVVWRGCSKRDALLALRLLIDEQLRDINGTSETHGTETHDACAS